MQHTFEWLDSQYPSMCKDLHNWANINSGTFHLAGLAQMASTLSQAFLPLESTYQTFNIAPFEEFDSFGEKKYREVGQVLLFRKRPELTRRILLVGHMDTVYGPDHPFQTARLISPTEIHGPGVADMKGGLVIMLYALLAFEQSPFSKQIGWDIILNSDEEIGSLGSAAILNTYAKQAQVGLVFEPALDIHGTLAGARKGSGKFTLIAKGKAAHAGRSFEEGKNAIIGLSEAMVKIHQLNGQRPNITINVGTVQGGSAVNVVPAVASCQIDVRLTESSDEEWIKQALAAIVQQASNSGVTLELHGHFGRKPKIMNAHILKLYALLKQISEELAIPISWQDCGGCCDGNNLFAAGLPVIDSLGVYGGKIHSDQEFALLPSLLERAKLVTHLMLAIAQGKLKI